jgi:cbb3-type cytochrome oxidase maturation protein
MESLYLLIPLSLVIVAIAVWIFIRASETGQFDDLVGPAHSILMDDDRPRSAGDAGDSHRKPQKPPASTD